MKLIFLYVSSKPIWFGLVWLNMPKLLHNDELETYSEDRYDPVSYVYWTPVSKGPHEITIVYCTSLLWLLSSTLFLRVVD